MAEPIQYFPMPIRQRTIAPTVPDTEQASRGKSQRDHDEMRFSPWLPRPSKKVEEDQCGMENHKEIVGRLKEISIQ